MKNAHTTLIESIHALNSLKKTNTTTFNALILELKGRKGKIVTTGIGKSSFIARKMAATLSSLGIESFFVHPAEAMHGDSGMVMIGDVLIALSYSGESEEVIRFVKHEKHTKKIKVYSITAKMSSTLSKISDGLFLVPVRSEGSPHNLAPMASITATLVMCDMISSELIDSSFKEEHFARLHPGGLLGLKYIQVSERQKTGKDVPLVGQNETFTKTLLEISKKKKGIVGIIDNSKKLRGVLTDGDIRRIAIKYQQLSLLKLKYVMHTQPKTISTNASLHEALRLMREFKITSLFTLEKNKTVSGIIHIHDILNSEI